MRECRGALAMRTAGYFNGGSESLLNLADLCEYVVAIITGLGERQPQLGPLRERLDQVPLNQRKRCTCLGKHGADSVERRRKPVCDYANRMFDWRFGCRCTLG